MFGQSDNRFFFSESILNIPSLHAEPELLHLHEKLASEHVAKLERQDVVARVNRIIGEILETGVVNLEQVALKLGIKPRTLRTRLSEANTKIGAEYIAANAKKEGVVVTESGLQYKEIKAGTGDMPKASDKVKVHYKGTLIDGTVFDSSIDRGEPATFPVTGVIKGWIEALQLMNVGDKFQLTIPPELAYGEKGTGSDIGPNATLLFDVELIEIMK